MKPRLIDNKRHAWKLWSVQLPTIASLLFGLAAAAPGLALELWNQLPDQLRDLLPTHAATAIAAVLFGANVVLRLLKQGKRDAE